MTDSPVDVQATVGPTTRANGATGPLRSARQGELVVSQAHGRYHDAAVNGKLFHASIGAAGVAPGTALGTAPPLALWNPPNSGVNLSIKQVFASYISGTLGAGALVHAVNPSQVAAPTSGAELTPQSGLIGATRGAGRAFTGSTISATAVILRPSAILTAELASTANQVAVIYDEVDGSMVVPPGALWCYQGIAAAGSTPLVLLGVTWEETPV